MSPVRRILEPQPVQLGVGLQPLARSLLGSRAAALFEGLVPGRAARLRGLAMVQKECIQGLRERLATLRKAGEADLLAAEPELRRLLADALEPLPARASLELDRALDSLVRAERAGLEHDLEHLRRVLSGARAQLTARQGSLLERVDVLGREIDELMTHPN
jgi:hypothetical protein